MEFKNDAFDRLMRRGFVYQSTHSEEMQKRLEEGPVTFYLGIDPTADNLHIGHFFSLQMFRILQDCGHRGILVIGGATGLIGDPSGKKDMRKMLSKEEVEHNTKELMNLVKQFIITEGDNAALILDNGEWIKNRTYIDFMREVGIHFNVNNMLACEAYKGRLAEGGLTFLEMGYMLMQAYDFVYLNRTFDCVLEIGGSDQWGNIIAGVDLLKKMNLLNGNDKEIIMGLTCPLLTNANGVKMGKTEKGTLWVSRDKTSVFDFYQHFINAMDADVERLLRFFTDIDVNEIISLCSKDIVSAKKLMAFEVTKLVHGEESALKAKETSQHLFSGCGQDSNMPTEIISFPSEEALMADFLSLTSIFPSKSEIRRLISQNGIILDDKKVTSHEQIVSTKQGQEHIIKKGKKVFLKIIVK